MVRTSDRTLAASIGHEVRTYNLVGHLRPAEMGAEVAHPRHRPQFLTGGDHPARDQGSCDVEVPGAIERGTAPGLRAADCSKAAGWSARRR